MAWEVNRMAAMDWKRICCPVDFSEPSRSALRAAADLSRRFGSELLVLHIDDAGKIAAELPPTPPEEAALAALKQEAERLGASHVTVVQAAGQPEVSILDFARTSRVDLIVMGTHGRVDREHMLTGSVTEAVVRNARCPVLTVHPEDARDHAGDRRAS